ncbi:phosphotransferase [Novosphingobium sp.]|uniref:phosphotransferase n=1 Tax=Novosphingobium sp. TaxID=1874826 RepID=UPI0035B16B2C
MVQRSPKELIELYWTEVWNNRNVEMIRELCADPIIRHDAGSTTALSLEDQIARVRQQSEKLEPYFEHEVLLADDTHVTSVWNMHTRKGERVELCGIEVFKAVNGKFTDCWNSTYVPGRWGREGDAAVSADLPPPVMIAALDQITPQWLQAVFQHGGIEAPRVSLASSQEIGHGNLSTTCRTEITYNANAEKAVRSVVCKITAPLPEAVGIAAMQSVYQREAAVYAFFGAEPPFATPRCYWHNAGADGRTLNLVLEDLTQRTRPGNQVAGCSREEARAVVAEFAWLHAAYWRDPRLDGADWLLNRRAQTGQAGETQLAAAAEFRRRYAGRIADECLAVLDAFAPQVDAVTRALPEGQTLIHGELRVDNVLFEDLPEGPKAWLIDWQFADRGSPMFDTAYFLAGSLDPEDRRAVEHELIALHQAEIAKVDPAYTLEQAQTEFKACLPIALYFSVGAVLAIPSSEPADRLLITLVERNVAALKDWGCV